MYISNENNVKGLEFPFTISVLLTDVGNSIKLRNSLYMSLTRSFITSYLIMNKDTIDERFIDIYKNASIEIIEKGVLNLEEPSDEEIKNMKNKITMQKTKPLGTLEQVNALLNLKTYSFLSEEDKNLIINKVKSNWSTLSSDEILNKAKNLADSLG